MKKGTLISDGLANNRPANIGLIAAPKVRATPVMPAAAERSSGRTAAITYDCLVGTSIWLMLKRTSSSSAAIGRVLINGMRIRRTFDGRWVATIVLSRPKRAASRAARSAEMPASTFAAKNRTPSVEVLLIQDQQPVETLRANGSHKPLGHPVCLGLQPRPSRPTQSDDGMVLLI